MHNPEDRSFIGHPRGLAYIAFTEAWERFSYYGMQALLALLMSAGHFLMAFDVTFLLALTCLLTGVGCFKGNLASQVGALYPIGDNRRADAFQIYYLFINGGVIAAPLIAGTLGEKVGWHY